MNNSFKKHISSATKQHKNFKKFFCIITMFLILTTTLSTVVNSQSLITNPIQNNLENKIPSDEPIITINKILPIKEKLLQFKQNIKNILEKLARIKNKSTDFLNIEKDTDSDYSSIEIESQKSPIIRGFRRLLRQKLLNLTVMFYTNYSGIENQVSIKFLQEKKIDVNNDSKDDIKVKLGLSFSIERFLHFSINFKYFITRLPDFPDNFAYFEAYSEIYFTGLLFLRQRNNRIRFGYESPLGEEVPVSCQIVYRYLPKIINIRKNPEHRVEINPVKGNGDSKLILLLSYTNFNKNNTVVSELKSRVVYNPAVESTVSIGGNGILGGSKFEFKREYSGDSQVDMYCSFEKNNKTIIGFVKDLPKKVTFTINFKRDGNIAFNTYNQAPSEIGVSDDFINPENKIYFTNLPSKAELTWNIRALIQQKLDVSFYTNSPGIYIKGDLKFPKNSTTNFTIYSKENLDSKMSLDLKQGYLGFQRNKVDINFDLSIKKINASFNFSTNISSFYDQPFEVFFGKLFDENAEVIFYGSYLKISDLNLIFLKSASNNTNDEDEIKLDSNNIEPIVPLEHFLVMSLSSLEFTARDFVKLRNDNETKELNFSAGGNGSIKLNDLFIDSNMLKVEWKLFEVESDHFYGSAINLSLNLSDIKNLSVESVALENAICKFLIEGLIVKPYLQNIINVTEFKANFSGCGIFELTYNNSRVDINGAICGPGSIELDLISELFGLGLLKIEDFRISGPTTYFIYGYFEKNEFNETEFRVIGGVNNSWHLGKFYIEVSNIPLIEIKNCNGEGQISIGTGLATGGILDIIFSISGNWNWEKIYFVPFSENTQRPGIHSGSFSGNITLNFRLNLKTGSGHFSGTVYSITRLDHFKIESNNWLISGVSFQMKPGDFYLYWREIFNLTNAHYIIDNSGTIDLEFDLFLIENKNTGKSFSFRSREVSVPHFEIMTELKGSGNGYLYLDTDNQYCNYEITKSEFIKINRTFRAENCNISWNFSGGIFNIIDISGFIEFGSSFEILVFINGQWRILISINQPVAEFTWSPTEPNVNDTIYFDASDSYFSEPITRYDWKWFGADVWHNNLGPYTNHSYSQEGNYKVSLRVWSGLKHSTCTKDVNVGNSSKNVNIVKENQTLFQGYPFEILRNDIQKDESLTNILVNNN